MILQLVDHALDRQNDEAVPRPWIRGWVDAERTSGDRHPLRRHGREEPLGDIKVIRVTAGHQREPSASSTTTSLSRQGSRAATTVMLWLLTQCLEVGYAPFLVRRGAGVSEAQRHRETAARFSQVVDGASDWDRPAPVAGWTARDVVGHLTSWLPGFLQGAGLDMLPVPADPVQAWHAHTAQVQAILEDRGTPDRILSNPNVGEMPLATAIDRIYTTDVFMRTWDLARATEQDATLDPDACAELLAGMQPIEDMLRNSG
jgi:hypothetical protein